MSMQLAGPGSGRRGARTAPLAGSRYGERVEALPDGTPLQAGVFDERQVRAAAGITMVLGAIAFVYAYFAKVYLPIRTVTTFFFVDFTLRVVFGLGYSPVGRLSRWLTAGLPREWVSARPKRFAWTLGLVMSLAMALITNARITGTLPMSICLLCLTLMWLEAVLGICLGCQVHRLLVHRGWARPDPQVEICADGACSRT
jgi:hypothetical protein